MFHGHAFSDENAFTSNTYHPLPSQQHFKPILKLNFDNLFKFERALPKSIALHVADHSARTNRRVPFDQDNMSMKCIPT